VFSAFLQRNQNSEFADVLTLLVSKRSYFNVQALKSVKHLQGRMQILQNITAGLKAQYLTTEQVAEISRYYPFDAVFAKLRETLKNQNGQVRLVSQEVLSAIYEQFGYDYLRDFAQAAGPGLLAPLIKRVPEFGEHVLVPEAAQRVTANGSPSPRKIRPATKPPPTCQFCSVREPGFKDPEQLDLHYLSYCLMLTNCLACGQIIEVSALNAHLVKECAQRSMFKQCKRCRESIAASEYDAHVALGACLPWKPPGAANRCALCHKDIGPGERGWRQHLMQKRCPAHERNNPAPVELIEEPPREIRKSPSNMMAQKSPPQKIEAIIEEAEENEKPDEKPTPLDRVHAGIGAKKDSLDAIETELNQAEKALQGIKAKDEAFNENAQKVNHTIRALEETNDPEGLAKGTIQSQDEVPAEKPRDATEID
jgi:hypothetical protein